jgi:hypothetical protein
VRNAVRAQLLEQLDGARQRPPLRQQLAEEPPWRAWILSASSGVSGRPSSRATARVKRPPLMPIRRWIFQPSIGISASFSARCQAKTCA